MGLRQPRLRPDRRPRQGRQARLRLGRRDRPRRQPAARRDEEDRLRAAAALLPVPGAGPAGARSPEAKNALSVTIFEEQPPFTANPGAAEFVKIYRERAAKAGLPDTSVETQAAASYTAWQILEAGVDGDQEPRRQGDRRPGSRRTGSTPSRASCASTARQLRRRPDAHQAGAERQVGRRLAEGSRRRRRREAAGARERRACRASRCPAFRCWRRASCRASSSARCTACWGWASACAGACCG